VRSSVFDSYLDTIVFMISKLLSIMTTIIILCMLSHLCVCVNGCIICLVVYNVIPF